MRTRKKTDINFVRLLDAQQGAAYCGMGRDTFRRWAETIGAVRRFGRLIRFDREIIDAALDAQGRPSAG